MSQHTNEHDINNKQEKSDKTHRKRVKIRSLLKPEATGLPSKKSPVTLIFLLIIGPALILLISMALVNFEEIYEEFLKNYNRQFHSIVDGNPNFCDEKLNSNFLNKLKEFMVGQDSVIEELHNLFQSERKFLSIGFYGSHGSGKTLLGNLLKRNWHWSENVQKFLWSFFSKDIRSLSSCGYNLLIIDDIPWNSENLQLAKNLNNYLKNLTETEKFQIVLIFLFNQSSDGLKELSVPDFKLVKFNKMTENSIIDCIRINAFQVNIELTEREIKEFLKEINFEETGCKNVQRKLELFKLRET